MIRYKIINNSTSILKKKIIFLHGFMGCYDDWNIIVNNISLKFECIIILLDSMKSFYDYIVILGNFIIKMSWNKNSYIIGYSMGGRIGLELCKYNYFDYEKLILISTNMGFDNNIIDVKKKEIIYNIKSLEPYNFLKYWYNQPMFGNYELYRNIIKNRLKYFDKDKYIHYINNWSVKNQISSSKIKIMLYIYGELDYKYVLYSKTITNKTQKICIKNAYHSILTTHSKEISEIILKLL